MMADGGLVSNSGIGPNYQSVPSTRNKGGPNIVPLTPLLQYILFRWSDFILIFICWCWSGKCVHWEKISIGHYCLHTDHQWWFTQYCPTHSCPSIHSVPARWSDFISRVCKIWCLSEKCVHWEFFSRKGQHWSLLSSYRSPMVIHHDHWSSS